jgi:hypothetical protein
MKTLIMILLLFISCAQDETGTGCVTATESGTRVFVTCCTKQQFNAGNYSRTAQQSNFKWEASCGNCK